MEVDGLGFVYFEASRLSRNMTHNNKHIDGIVVTTSTAHSSSETLFSEKCLWTDEKCKVILVVLDSAESEEDSHALGSVTGRKKTPFLEEKSISFH